MAALARVGLTESQANTRGHQVKIATMPLAVSPRAKTLREITWLWNAVVDADSDKDPGPRCWARVEEVIAAVQPAMLGG